MIFGRLDSRKPVAATTRQNPKINEIKTYCRKAYHLKSQRSNRKINVISNEWKVSSSLPSQACQT